MSVSPQRPLSFLTISLVLRVSRTRSCDVARRGVGPRADTLRVLSSCRRAIVGAPNDLQHLLVRLRHELTKLLSVTSSSRNKSTNFSRLSSSTCSSTSSASTCPLCAASSASMKQEESSSLCQTSLASTVSRNEVFKVQARFMNGLWSWREASRSKIAIVEKLIKGGSLDSSSRSALSPSLVVPRSLFI